MHSDDPLAAPFWIRVGVALFCAVVIGIERQLRGKPAGIRTSVLVCLGTATFIRLGVVVQGTTGDPTRVLGQVVTGIGFLGAGVIITRGGLVQGVTSAAVVWILAAIGAAVGFDLYAMAVALSVVTVGTLVGVERLEQLSAAFRRGVHSDDPKSPEGVDDQVRTSGEF